MLLFCSFLIQTLVEKVLESYEMWGHLVAVHRRVRLVAYGGGRGGRGKQAFYEESIKESMVA